MPARTPLNANFVRLLNTLPVDGYDNEPLRGSDEDVHLAVTDPSSTVAHSAPAATGSTIPDNAASPSRLYAQPVMRLDPTSYTGAGLIVRERRGRLAAYVGRLHADSDVQVWMYIAERVSVGTEHVLRIKLGIMYCLKQGHNAPAWSHRMDHIRGDFRYVDLVGDLPRFSAYEIAMEAIAALLAA